MIDAVCDSLGGGQYDQVVAVAGNMGTEAAFYSEPSYLRVGSTPAMHRRSSAHRGEQSRAPAADGAERHQRSYETLTRMSERGHAECSKNGRRGQEKESDFDENRSTEERRRAEARPFGGPDAPADTAGRSGKGEKEEAGGDQGGRHPLPLSGRLPEEASELGPVAGR